MNPDFDRIILAERKAAILYDRNITGNVARARFDSPDFLPGADHSLAISTFRKMSMLTELMT